MSTRPDPTHYEVLGVHAGASVEELTAARRGLALKFHPDRHQDSTVATQMMALINRAYDVLSTPALAVKYRAELRTTHQDCAACGARGWIKRQKGFRKMVLEPCGICGGVGMTRKNNERRK